MTLLKSLVAALRNTSAPRPIFNLEVIRSFLAILFGVVIFFVIFRRTIHLVAYYVLPVSTPQEHGKMIDRLYDYLSGMHGPAIFIKGGEKVARSEELTKKGRGVVLVDPSSAVVIERRTSTSAVGIGRLFKRLNKWVERIFGKQKNKSKEPKVKVFGPGIVFTDEDEVIRGFADLRPQFRIRTDVNAYTRDGIEVLAHVLTRFTLGEPPVILTVTYEGEKTAKNLRVVYLKESEERTPAGRLIRKYSEVEQLSDELDAEDKNEIHLYVQHHTFQNCEEDYPKPQDPSKPYDFNADRIFSAVYGKAQDAENNRVTEWSDLPADVAAKIFRNILARETYDALYSPNIPNPSAFRPEYQPPGSLRESFQLPIVKAKFALDMRNQGILAYQFVERRDPQFLKTGDEWKPDQLLFWKPRQLHSPKVLRSHGIKAYFASFSVLKPTNPNVRQHLVERWRARWQSAATATLAEHELKASRILARARSEAQKEVSEHFAKIFQSNENSEEALAIHVYQALEELAATPKIKELLPGDTIQMLQNLRNWFIPAYDPLFPDRSNLGQISSNGNLPYLPGEEENDSEDDTLESDSEEDNSEDGSLESANEEDSL